MFIAAIIAFGTVNITDTQQIFDIAQARVCEVITGILCGGMIWLRLRHFCWLYLRCSRWLQKLENATPVSDIQLPHMTSLARHTDSYEAA